MASENASLREFIKRNVNFEIKDLEMRDTKDEKTLDGVDQLGPGTRVRMRVAPGVGRPRAFTMQVEIEKDMTATLIGTPGQSLPEPRFLEDASDYLLETKRYAGQIVEALNKALKEKRDKP